MTCRRLLMMVHTSVPLPLHVPSSDTHTCNIKRQWAEWIKMSTRFIYSDSRKDSIESYFIHRKFQVSSAFWTDFDLTFVLINLVVRHSFSHLLKTLKKWIISLMGYYSSLEAPIFLEIEELFIVWFHKCCCTPNQVDPKVDNNLGYNQPYSLGECHCP